MEPWLSLSGDLSADNQTMWAMAYDALSALDDG